MSKRPEFMHYRTLFRRTALIALAASAVLLICNALIIWETHTGVHDFESIARLPDARVGLVLGTSRSYPNGSPNPHFKNRIEAAANLFHSGKLRHLILSGGSDSRYYNEPEMMKKAIIKRGVPATALTLDSKGKRTLDSVLRAKYVYAHDSLTIISDRFHVYRALFICANYDIDARAYASREVPWMLSWRTRVREYFARVKAIADLYIFRISPEDIGIQQATD
ncbi:MAG TPA: SanA protein [Bacteroidetes bacterium]|nr:SanA protein [Bacteroidota bacterium]